MTRPTKAVPEAALRLGEGFFVWSSVRDMVFIRVAVACVMDWRTGDQSGGGGGYNLDRPFHQARCDPIPEGGDKGIECAPFNLALFTR